MATSRIPPAPILHNLLTCDFETGTLTWKPRPPELFSAEGGQQEAVCRSWNTRFAGKPAFTADDGRGYRTGAIFKVHIAAHRIIWKMAHDEEPEQIDHINGRRDDNRLLNLRAVTNLENGQNQGLSRRNGWGVCGVTWSEGSGKWRARISPKGRAIHLGYFNTIADAQAAREQAALRYGFHPNHGTAR